MDAMTFESVICLAHHCDRGGVDGADTYYYNQMETLERNLSVRSLDSTDEERLVEYHRVFAAVRLFVRKAIEAAIKDCRFHFSTSERAALQHFADELTSRMYDRRRLDHIIEDTETLLLKYSH